MFTQVCVSGFRLGTAFRQYPDTGHHLQWQRDEQCEGWGVGELGVGRGGDGAAELVGIDVVEQ